MILYLIETFGLLLTAGCMFFALGIGWGWLTWGRLKKSAMEWRHNSERLNARISALEDEADRREVLKAEIENEKTELVGTLSAKQEYIEHLEGKLGDATEGLENAFTELEQREGEVKESRKGSAELEERANFLEEKLNERIALIEQLNYRHDVQVRDKESQIGILKAKLLAAEQSSDSQRQEIATMAKRLAAAGKLTPEEVKLKTRRANKANRVPEEDPVLTGGTDPVHPDDAPQLDLQLG
ncbi:MAG: hypothetical protein AAGJ79_05515 [Verrucomicrobiota bacterium]